MLEVSHARPPRFQQKSVLPIEHTFHSTTPANLPVGDDGGREDLTMGFEELANLILVRAERKVAYIELH